MKKRVVLYAIYCCTIIFVIAAFLVFRFTNKNDDEETSRAEYILLNTPREITITTNKEIKLLNGFISVEPANAMELITYSISASATTNVDNIDFNYSEKSFVARKTGYYYITFAVPKNAYSNLTDTLKIHAIADTKQDFSLKTNQITIGQSVEFNEIFNQNSVFEYSVELENDNLTFSNNRFYANKEGVTKVFIIITRDYVRYTNEYEIHVEKDFSKPQIPEDKGDETGKDENQEGEGNQGGEQSGETGDNQGETGDGGDSGGEGDNNEDEDNPNSGDQSGESSGGNTEEGEGNEGDSGESSGGQEQNPDKGNEGDNEGKGEQTGGESEQKPQEKYEIVIKSESFNKNSKLYIINYEVLLNSNEYIFQKLTVTISNPSIAVLYNSNPPFIRLKILKSGTFTLTLTLMDNPEVSINLEISVVLENEKT